MKNINNNKENKKTCTECLAAKNLSEFYSREAHSKTKGDYIYYNPKCKKCVIEASMKWEKDNPRKHKENVKRRDSVEWRKKRRKKISAEYSRSGKYLEWLRSNKEKVKGYQQKYKKKKHVISAKEWNKCKDYFGFLCAYCGINEADHKKKHKQGLHKEHVIHDGRRDIKNCVPSCRSCNSSKHKKTLNEWYNNSNPNYAKERYLKIYYWIRYDCKKPI